jgi:GNAT superfamily N-acetyltransferase
VQAIARILAQSPEATPDFLRIEGGNLQLVPSTALAEQAAELLLGTYWHEGDGLATIVASHLSSPVWLGAVNADGRLLGCLRAVSDRSFRVLLMDVFVLPSERHRQIGRRLMEVFLAHPLVRGARHVELGTRDKAHFYEHFGFEITTPVMTRMRLRAASPLHGQPAPDAAPGARDN